MRPDRCGKGHVEGRYPNGQCKVCHRASARASMNRKRRPVPWEYRKVPAAPIRGQLVLAFDHDEPEHFRVARIRRQYAERFHLDKRQVERDLRDVLRGDTITIAKADRWATFLGLHLDLLYPASLLALPDEVLV